MNAESSAIVVMMGDGRTTVVFLSTPISTRLCRLRSWSAIGCVIIVSEASPSAAAAIDSLGVDDLCALLPLGLGLAGHGALHAVGQLNVLEFDEGHLNRPRQRRDVEDLPDVLVDAISLRERLVETVLADDLPKGRLGNLVNLVNCRLDILDCHNGFLGVHHPVLGDCGNIDAHVVARDDALRLNRLRDDPKRYEGEDIHDRQDDSHSRLTHTDHLAEPKVDAPLTLPDDAHRQSEEQEDEKGDDRDDDDLSDHGVPLALGNMHWRGHRNDCSDACGNNRNAHGQHGSPFGSVLPRE